MINQYLCLAILYLTCLNTIFTQDIYPRNTSVDVQNYIFNLHLNDENNSIKGKTIITVSYTEDVDQVSFDLIGKSGDFGMEVINVLDGKEKASYTFSDNKIVIRPLNKNSQPQSFTIEYQGIAERGLVIDTTKFGQRSFFGDNWPNLARHWLPCVDHPYDKASIEFRITAPEHYDVVATGKKIEESNIGDGLKLTCYKEPAPVPMKVVTIGVTKFASKLLGKVGDIPVSAWVYPENRLDGFHDYQVAVDVLEFFIERIGPYAYAKLANMQAKTQWGGLENAGTIAYFENSVTGKNKVEGLIAHEIAHQWFGNSATENSWNHVWLSEGFATYFAILYQEHVYGNEKRKEELQLDRNQVIGYYKKNPAPIVDLSIKNPMKVLSINTYQKASWFLNMLRHRLGDEIFWKGIKTYYQTYENSNAMTIDFRKVMEEVSGDKLESFFQQWLFIKGHPQIEWSWKYENGKLKIQLKQLQIHHTYNFPLDIGIKIKDQLQIKTIQVKQANEAFELTLDQQPSEVILDPELWLLFEEK